MFRRALTTLHVICRAPAAQAWQVLSSAGCGASDPPSRSTPTTTRTCTSKQASKLSKTDRQTRTPSTSQSPAYLGPALASAQPSFHSACRPSTAPAVCAVAPAVCVNMTPSGKPTGMLPNPYAKVLPNPYAAATVAEAAPVKSSEEQAKAETKKLPGIYLLRTFPNRMFTAYAIV